MNAQPHELQPFCPGCGLVDKIDSDGTCGYCGGDTCGLDQVREHLAEHGLHVVSAAEKAVLDAMTRVPGPVLRSTLRSNLAKCDESDAVARAELARREAAK